MPVDRDVHADEDAHCGRPVAEVFLCDDQSMQHVEDKLRQSVVVILLMWAERGGCKVGHGTRIDLSLG